MATLTGGTGFVSVIIEYSKRLYSTLTSRYSNLPLDSSSGHVTAHATPDSIEPHSPTKAPSKPAEELESASQLPDGQTEVREGAEDATVTASPTGVSKHPNSGSDSQMQTESATESTSVVAIVPAYNEAETLADVVRDAALYVDDVIVIDDDSSDDTADIADAHADGVISHRRNMGVGAAVSTGYRAVIRDDYDIVVQLDGDGQHDPAYIPRLLEQLHEREADMVIGSRWLNESHEEYSLVRRAGIRFFTAEVNALTGLSLTDITSGFRVYRTTSLEELGTPSKSHWAIEQTLESARNGHKLEEVSVPMPPEPDGSQFDVVTLLKYPPRMLLTTVKILLFR